MGIQVTLSGFNHRDVVGGWSRALLWLVDVLVRVLLVPSLTLPVAHCVVDLASVVLAITRDAHLCKHNSKGVRPDEDLMLRSHYFSVKKSAILDRNITLS